MRNATNCDASEIVIVSICCVNDVRPETYSVEAPHEERRVINHRQKRNRHFSTSLVYRLGEIFSSVTGSATINDVCRT